MGTYRSLHVIVSLCFQVVLSMIVVHLHESDYVAADNCYKESFQYVPYFYRVNFSLFHLTEWTTEEEWLGEPARFYLVL